MKNLCTPAALYFGISMVTIIIVLFQNLQNTHSYTVGTFTCRVPNTLLIFLAKVVYVVFWTYVLNLICKDGHVGLSWLLVLLPWILMAVIMGMLLINK